MKADFGGYATKAGLKCTDGLVIMPDAFKHQDSMQVPLVWQHGHNSPDNILGHAILEAREDGIYAHGYFNEKTPQGQTAKALVEHGDIKALSIYAGNLAKKSTSVLHGVIAEVSLVLKGANPGALIDYVRLAHSDEYLDDEAVIYTGLELELAHADDSSDEDKTDDDSSDDERTVKDIYDSFSEEQKNVVHYMIGAALETNESDDSEDNKDDESGDSAQHNDNDDESLNHKDGIEMRRVFENNSGAPGIVKDDGSVLSHSDMQAFAHSVFEDFKKHKSFKDAVIAHAGEYGITNIEVLFPDAKNVDNQPEWITRRMEWVDGVLNGARKLPFSRIKSRSADLTHEEARAKGYVKATLKKEQFFEIAGRETTPKTIYKKQKLDRDDIIDITDFDVVAWIWQEMRFMLREEIARAILVGDGRDVSDEDKINENNIRPIAKDDDFYTHKVNVPANTKGESLIEAILRSRKYYKGVGNPTMYTTEDLLTDLLLLKDRMGRRLFRSEADLATELRVSNIVTVDIMEGQVASDGSELLAVLVNMSDYSIGTDKGGEITTFDQFDIDYNQYKYLIEGRMSGALTQHKRALAVLRGAGTEATPSSPSFNSETNTITIPSVTGVSYYIDGDEVTGTVVIEEDTLVEAEADEGYFFAPGSTTTWVFEYNAG